MYLYSSNSDFIILKYMNKSMIYIKYYGLRLINIYKNERNNELFS